MKKIIIYCRYTVVFALLLTILSCKDESIPSINDYGNAIPENVRLTDYTSSSVTVEWDSVAAAASYTVELLDSVGAVSPIDGYTTTSKDFYTFTNLNESGNYYVRVRANFNTVKNPVIGDWAYLMNGENPARIIPAYGIVDENFKIPNIYPNFPEGFENPDGKRKGSYTGTGPTGDQSEFYPSGEWEMYRSYTTNSGTALLHKVGDFAVMLSPNVEGYVAMDFDLPYGANRLTFVTGSATKTNKNDINNMPITLSVFYSVDKGASWNKIDDIVIDDVEKQYTPEYDNLGIEGPVRFKFQKDGGVARPIVDEVTVYYTN